MGLRQVDCPPARVYPNKDPVIDELYNALRRVTSIDIVRLREYIDDLRQRLPMFGPAERFLFVLAPLMFYYAWTALPQSSTKVPVTTCLAIAFGICGFGLYCQARDTLRGGRATLVGVSLLA